MLWPAEYTVVKCSVDKDFNPEGRGTHTLLLEGEEAVLDTRLQDGLWSGRTLFVSAHPGTLFVLVPRMPISLSYVTKAVELSSPG